MWWALLRLLYHLCVRLLLLGSVHLVSLHPSVVFVCLLFSVRLVDLLEPIVAAIGIVFVAIALLQDALDHALSPCSFIAIPACRWLSVPA